jgi:hypothetical protein
MTVPACLPPPRPWHRPPRCASARCQAPRRLQPGGERARRSARSSLAVAVATAALVLAGCTAARNDLGTPASPCFKALPVAYAAVGGHGRLFGVNLVPPRLLERPRLGRLDALLRARNGGPVDSVCLVVFRDDYRFSELEQPAGAPLPGGSGRFAFVVVSSPGNKLLATFLRNGVPRRVRLRHRHLGG